MFIASPFVRKKLIVLKMYIEIALKFFFGGIIFAFGWELGSDFAKEFWKEYQALDTQQENVPFQASESAKLSVPPKVRVGGRVIDLVDASHLDDLLQDTPSEMKPNSVVMVHRNSDKKSLEKWIELAENKFSSRDRLLVASYNVDAAPLRHWYEFTPEMDLIKRYNITKFPAVFMVPPVCDGYIEWCVREEKMSDDGTKTQILGCEDYKDPCQQFIDHYPHHEIDEKLVKWIKDREIVPLVSPKLGSVTDQEHWLKLRDETTNDNQMRNLYMTRPLKRFTPSGFKAVPIPKEAYKELMDFYNQNRRQHLKSEYWSAESTQVNQHETSCGFVSLDLISEKRNEIANRYFKPILEEWANSGELELTSFYGIREYYKGSSLKLHNDRIATHVLSITLSLAQDPQDVEWPLEVISFDGKRVRYTHPAGTMVLYESAALPHGRAYRFDGNLHAGCFVHFKPKDNSWTSEERRGQENKRRQVRHVNWKSTPVVDKHNEIRWTSVNYGETTTWTHVKGGPPSGS